VDSTGQTIEFAHGQTGRDRGQTLLPQGRKGTADS